MNLEMRESYYCEENVYRKLMEPFGIGVWDNGEVYILTNNKSDY